MSSMRRWLLTLTTALWAYGVPLVAHHSLSDYESSRRTTLTGVIAQFQFVNPHPFLIVDVRDTSGAAQQWRLEMDNLWELTEAGITKDTLKFGDRIVVTGNPGRSQQRIMYIQSLDRPADGFGYEQVGSRPRVRARAR
jgi:hypothetical protein